MIYSQPSFTRRYNKLTPANQSRVDAAVARLESAFGRPHLHAGIGIRPFGRYLELRVGASTCAFCFYRKEATCF